LEFRGGVNDPYFVGATITVVNARQEQFQATITSLDAKATPFKRVRATLAEGSPGTIAPGDIARWHFPRAEIIDGCIHTDACDDLAAVAAALCVLEEMLSIPEAAHVGVLLTVAEEVGFLGAIHAARQAWVPKSARLICLENSRSFPNDSPIGAGAILRVGDRLSVFTPDLTNELTRLFAEEKKRNPTFAYQRKLMAGGACEATAFAAYGYHSTCLCLPLGNYHNMVDIDGVAAGAQPAKVGRECVSVEDFHSLCAMLHLAAVPHATTTVEAYDALMERLYKERADIMSSPRS
jgi:endoglucanase